MAGLIEIIKDGLDELDSDQLEQAEKSFARAWKACSSEEDKQEVLRCLLKLAGKYIRLNISDKPETLYKYLESTDVSERTRVMERLARLHHQVKNLDVAERIYTEIFQTRAKLLGSEHPDVLGALQTAALLRQMQGKSPEDLYIKAYEISKAAAAAKQASEPKPEPKPAAPQKKAKQDKTGLNKPAGWDEKKTKDKSSSASIEDEVKEARKKSGAKNSTLFMLDELLMGQVRAEAEAQKEEEKSALAQEQDEMPELGGKLTLHTGLQELIAAWEPFCNLITAQLVKLLQQNSNPAYRKTLVALKAALSDSAAIKQVNLEHPFLGSARSAESRNLDWQILKELAPVFAAYNGQSNTYPFEITMIYGCLRRAFQLGPLHVDTLQSLHRLSNVYANEIFGCYDPTFAAAGFRICVLAFIDHPEIDKEDRIRCRSILSEVLVTKREYAEAKQHLKEAIAMADSCESISSAEQLSMLKALAACTHDMGDYESSAGVWERIRNFQEVVSRDSELFETFLQLISIHKKAGNQEQMQNYQQRLNWELDWLEDANPVREVVAARAEEIGEVDLAEILLHDIIMHSTPFEPVSGRAAMALIRIYEKTGRHEMAAMMKGSKK